MRVLPITVFCVTNRRETSLKNLCEITNWNIGDGSRCSFEREEQQEKNCCDACSLTASRTFVGTDDKRPDFV